jgi:hypothetical protein
MDGCRDKNKQNTRTYKCGFGFVNDHFRTLDEQYFFFRDAVLLCYMQLCIAVEDGRSRVRFRTVSLQFFIEIILPVVL